MGKIISAIADFIRETDKLLLILCFFASTYGCMAVYSATAHNGSARPLIVQSFCMIAGIVAAVFISRIDYQTYLERWYLFAAGGLIPVILTFFIGFAPGETDDKAWLDLGITTFQPSELLKICFMITFAAHLSHIKPNINKLKYLLPACFHGAIPVLLIHFQGDDGTALVFAIMVLFMLWAAGVSWKYFAVAISTIVIASPIIYFFVMNDDHRARIKSIFDIEADIQGIGFQQWRGRTALANGGFTGQGYLKGSLTSAGLVPEGHNDFIFVSIGEELGFLGCMAVIILLAAICFRCIRIARMCSKDSGKLICVGMFAMLFAQAVINIGMCVSVLPVIGITLPFFSAGGTSLLCLFLGVGLVLSVYMHRNSRTIYLRG
ncbi:MAG: rod shape-determining protein RodA [Clostridia bacterium]|nr:rod shape-determining protein RodA [Clostridia bacterium]MEE1184898.1 FtsW/RodA/SpoVE family cell cycle protein [Acutalibacteraceae bacterium]